MQSSAQARAECKSERGSWAPPAPGEQVRVCPYPHPLHRGSRSIRTDPVLQSGPAESFLLSRLYTSPIALHSQGLIAPQAPGSSHMFTFIEPIGGPATSPANGGALQLLSNLCLTREDWNAKFTSQPAPWLVPEPSAVPDKVPSPHQVVLSAHCRLAEVTANLQEG